MNNQGKLVQCYSDVLDVLSDYTFELKSSNNDMQVEELMGIIERLTTNLKRIGETQIIETVEYDLEPKEQKQEDKNIEEEGEAE